MHLKIFCVFFLYKTAYGVGLDEVALTSEAENDVARNEEVMPDSSQSESTGCVQQESNFDTLEWIGSAMNKDVAPCEDFYEFMCGHYELSKMSIHNWNWTGIPKMIPYSIENSCAVDEFLKLEPSANKARQFYEACMNQESRNTQGLTPLINLLNELQLGDISMLHKDRILLSRTLGLLQNRLGENFLFRIKDLSTSNPSVVIAHPLRDMLNRHSDEGRADYLYAIRDTLNLILPLLPANKYGGSISLREAKVIGELEENLFKRAAWRLRLVNRSLQGIKEAIDFQEFFTAAYNGVENSTKVLNTDYWDVLYDADDASYFDHWFTFLVHDEFYGPYLGLFLQWCVIRAFGSELNSQVYDIIYPPNRPYTFGHQRACLHSTFKELPEIAMQSFVKNGSDHKFKMDYINSLHHRVKNWPLKLMMEELYSIQHPKEMKFYPERGFYDSLNLGSNHFENVLQAKTLEARNTLKKFLGASGFDVWDGRPKFFLDQWNIDGTQCPPKLYLPLGLFDKPYLENDLILLDFAGGFFTAARAQAEISHEFIVRPRKYDQNRREHYHKFLDRFKDNSPDSFQSSLTCLEDNFASISMGQEKKLNIRPNMNQMMIENFALEIAFDAFSRGFQMYPEKEQLFEVGTESYNYPQLFFMHVARQWCQHLPPESEEYLLAHGPMPIRHRVNGLFKSSPQFQQIWGCKSDSNLFMNAEKQCSSFSSE